MIIEGDVNGTLEANKKLEIHDSGKCTGDIFAPSVKISDKAFFEGRVVMKNENKKTELSDEKKKEQLDPSKISSEKSNQSDETLKIKVVDVVPQADKLKNEQIKDKSDISVVAEKSDSNIKADKLNKKTSLA